MIAAAPLLAPEAGAAVGITSALVFSLFVLVVLYGLQHGWRYTFGKFLGFLADAVGGIPVVGGRLKRALEGADNAVSEALGIGIANTEKAVAALWGSLTWLVRETGDALVAFGADVHDAIAGIVFGEIPTQVEVRTRVIRRTLRSTATGLTARIEGDVRVLTRGVARVQQQATRTAQALRRELNDLERVMEFGLRRPLHALETRAAALTDYVYENLTPRLGRVEGLVLGSAIAAAALTVASRYFPQARCTNVRRFNRALCRLPLRDLDGLLALLGGAALLALALDPRLLAQAAEKVTAGLEGIIRETAIR